MNGDQLTAFLAAAAVGALTAGVAASFAIRAAPASLLRTNVSGRAVPAVLGLPLVAGGVLGLTAAWAVDRATRYEVTSPRVALALVVVLVVAGLAGYADDRRGDEAARGFGGHLTAAVKGRVTGGAVKIVGVGLAGLGAGLLVGGGWYVLEVALLVALGANLLNLLDRAPGRAAKVALLGALALVVFGSAEWGVAAGSVVGAAVACLVPDLHERAMLGDAGANPLGAALGLGVALSFDRPGRLVAIVLLALVNLASERWSFSRGIERVAPLRAFDRWGRR